MTFDKVSPVERHKFICEAVLLLEAISPDEAGNIWMWLNEQGDSNTAEPKEGGAFAKLRIILERLLKSNDLRIQDLLRDPDTCADENGKS